MALARYPALYQINTRVWLTERSRALHRPATLDDIPDADLDRLARMGFDGIWFLSVWQTGPAGQQVSRSNHEWRQEFEATLPDLREEDIAGSVSPSRATRCIRPWVGMRLCSGPSAPTSEAAWPTFDARFCP